MLLEYLLIAAALVAAGSAIGLLILTRVDDLPDGAQDPHPERERR